MPAAKKPAKVKAKNYWKGDEAELVTALSPFVQSPRFLRYHESYSQKQEKRVIVSQGELLRRLRLLSPSFCLTRGNFRRAFLKIAEDRIFLGAEDVATTRQWSEVSANRLKTMCRHFQQSWLKARGREVSWVRQVIGAQQTSEDTQDL